MARNADLEFRIDASVTGLPAVQQTQQRMKSLETQMNRSKYAVNQFGGALTGVEAKSRKFAMGALQQAGYQVGDYAVQVANGTSAMQAFGQQGSQLLGIFGPLGAVAGAAVAIFSAVGVAFAKTAEAAKDGTDEIKTLKDAMDAADGAVSRFSSTIANTRGTMDDLIRKYGQMNDDTREFITLQREIDQLAAIKSISTSFDMLFDTSEMQQATGDLGGVAEDILEARRALDQVTADFGVGAEETVPFIENLKEVEAAYSDLSKTLSETPSGKIMDASEAFATALNAKDIAGMNTAIINIRKNAQDLPVALKAELIPTLVQMEGVTRSLTASTTEMGEGIIDTSDDALGKLRQQIKLDHMLLGVHGARLDVLRALGSEHSKYSAAAINDTVMLMQAYMDASEELRSMQQQQSDIAKTIESSMSGAFMSIVDGTQTAEEAFRSMARDVIKELYRVLVVQQLVGSFDAATGSGSGIVGAVMKGVTGRKEMGGPVTAGKPYLVGEKRPELFIPSRNGTIKSDVGGGASIVINQSNTFGDGVSRGEINAMLPKIVETTKAAVFDAQRRSVTGRGY